MAQRSRAYVLRGNARYPYELLWQLSYPDGSRERGVMSRHRDETTARHAMMAATFAWARLIGAQRSPLHWLVRDIRDGSTIHIDPQTRGEKDHDQFQDTGPARLF